MIILPAHCSNENNSEGANTAVIYPDVKEISKRIATMNRRKKADQSLAKMCYWDDQIMFYFLSDAQIAELVVAAEANIDDQLFFRDPGNIMEEMGDPIRTDCEQFTVWDHKLVSWSAFDHYCSDRMETEQIHLDVLRELTKPKKGK